MTSSQQDWGTKGLGSVTQTSHLHPNAALDPSKVRFPPGLTVCTIGASTKGIGSGIATAFTKAGATALILAARRLPGLQKTAQECKTINPSVQTDEVECDVTSAESVAKLATHIKEKYGYLDTAIVNSGYSGPVVLNIEDTDPLTLAQATNVNYIGTFHCAKYLLPLLLLKHPSPSRPSQPQGSPAPLKKSFITISSFAAFLLRGPIANTQYCISKLAQLKLLEHIHEQYHPAAINAFALHPGAVESEMADETCPQDFRPFLTDSPHLCGAMCVWLTRGGEGGEEDRGWLSGRLVSAKWDVGELQARKEEVLCSDALKVRVALPESSR